MSRTSQALTNTDLAFLLCTLAASPQSPRISLSFETDYGLALSLEPDESITIRLRKHEPPAPCPMSKKDQYTDLLDPFDSATPIQSQQQLFAYAFPSAPVSHGSIDGVLFSPLHVAFGTGGATITPARSTPPSRLPPASAAATPTMTRTSSQRNPQQDMANKAGIFNRTSNMKIKYYIRPSGLDANSSSSSHMYYTASASASSPASASASTQPHHQPHPQLPHEPASNNNTKPTSKLRPRTLHRVKLSHLQSLYHTHLPSSTTGTSSSRKSSSSWFDAYLDWIDRLDDALALSRQRAAGQHEQLQTPQIPRAQRQMTSEPQGQTSGIMNQGGPFTDSGERSLWLVEGLLLASWLSLQEGVEGGEYLPLPHMPAETESGMEVYRLENLQGMKKGKEKGENANNAGVMRKRLLEVVRAEDME